MEDYNQILNSLLAAGPLAAVLFYFLVKLWEKIQIKDTEIRELHQELREIERSNTDAFNKLSTSITALSELIKTVLTNENKNR